MFFLFRPPPSLIRAVRPLLLPCLLPLLATGRGGEGGQAGEAEGDQAGGGGGGRVINIEQKKIPKKNIIKLTVCVREEVVLLGGPRVGGVVQSLFENKINVSCRLSSRKLSVF